LFGKSIKQRNARSRSVNKKRTGIITTLVLCLLVAALIPAQADTKSAPLNVNPTTGLFNIPIAAVVDPNQAVIGLHAVNALEWITDNAEDKPHDATGYLLIGAKPNLELSVLGTDEWGFSLNGQYLMHSAGSTSIAVGLQNITLHRGKQPWPDNKIKDLAGYVVLTQAIDTGEEHPLRLHVGAGTGRFDGIFGGIDFVPFRNLQLMGEWDGQETNVAARWTVYRKAEGAESFETRLVGALVDMDDPSIGIEFSWKQ
jgi:hypothetical protein